MAGPVATTADAVRLISEQAPDVALVDINLRDGELAHGLIDRLHGQGIRVVVMSGYDEVLLAPGKAATILQKPVSKAHLLATLRPITIDKAFCNEINRVIAGHSRPRGNSILQQTPSDASTCEPSHQDQCARYRSRVP